MTQQQRDNAAKYLYDLSKILVATAVIGNLLAGREVNMVGLGVGGGIAYLLFWWAHLLDGVKK